MQKLIRAAPGIQELFFLGRLFWLVELILQERGYCYDKILVDTPAMGHGVSLFETAGAVARLGMAGPLATECERVSKLLKNPEKTGVLFVTLPEELPVEESLDFLPQMTQHLQRPPLAVFMNQSINKIFFKNLDLLSTERWFLDLQSRFEHVQSSLELQFILSRLTKRHFFETKFIEQLQSNSDERYQKIPVLFLPDVSLFQKIHKPLDVIEFLLQHFSSSV
jgi:anion-transporting  ArsA/GET3 family ATPase